MPTTTIPLSLGNTDAALCADQGPLGTHRYTCPREWNHQCALKHGFPVIFKSGAPPAWMAANPDWLRFMFCCSARPPCVSCTSFGFEVIYVYVWKDPSKLMWGQAAFYNVDGDITQLRVVISAPITWPVRWLKTGLSLCLRFTFL